jgi:hypothetical protein
MSLWTDFRRAFASGEAIANEINRELRHLECSSMVRHFEEVMAEAEWRAIPETYRRSTAWWAKYGNQL